jgi:hypothetical protein
MLDLMPVRKVDRELSYDFSPYRTFTTLPLGAISPSTAGGMVLQDKALLFFVRSQLEEGGCAYVDLGNNPDFIITLAASSNYNEQWVPPQMTSFPVYVPGETVTSTTTSSGTISGTIRGSSIGYGTYSEYLSGYVSGSSHTTTTLPGRVETMTYTKPGYFVGHYNPGAVVEVIDGKSGRSVWKGIGAGTSQVADVKVSAQTVLSYLLRDLPACSQATAKPPGSGSPGIRFLVATLNGFEFRPFVLGFDPNSLARPAGIEEQDEVLAINGTLTVNKSLAEVSNMAAGLPGSRVDLLIRRGTIRRTVGVVRVAEYQRPKTMTLKQYGGACGGDGECASGLVCKANRCGRP